MCIHRLCVWKIYTLYTLLEVDGSEARAYVTHSVPGALEPDRRACAAQHTQLTRRERTGNAVGAKQPLGKFICKGFRLRHTPTTRRLTYANARVLVVDASAHGV